MENLKLYTENLERALITLNHEKAEEIITEAVLLGSPVTVAGELITDTLSKIGNSWEEGNLSLSQVYMSGVICEKIIENILPPQSESRVNQPKMAIGVFEDFHLLGKRIIYSTLRASGFELMDLGGGLNIQQIVALVKAENIKILLLSVLMLPSALRIKDLKKELTDVEVKIIVGGAPFRFDDQLWKEVGADDFGKDSSTALKIITELTGGKS